MIPETAAGTTIARRDLEAARAEPVGAVAELLRHGGHGVLGDRGDGRDEHHAHDEAGGEDVEDRPRPTPMSWRSGVKNVRAKKPKTTVGMPASTSSAGLSDLADPRPRVLAQVDRGAEPERQCDDAGPERDDERAGEQRQDAEERGLEERRPARRR